MDLSGFSIWKTLIQIGIIFSSILLGNVLRRKIKFIRNTLLPSSVIAGIFIFVPFLIAHHLPFLKNLCVFLVVHEFPYSF